MKRLAAVLLLGLGATGCVPFVYALPPLDLGADLSARASGARVDPQVNLNFGVRPLALLPELHQRTNDFSVGYTVTVTPGLLHGPYADVSHVFWQLPTSEKHLWRFRSGVLGRLVYDPSVEAFGGQGLVRAIIETSSLVDSDFSSSDSRGMLVGHALGEVGAGLYVETGILALPTQVGWTVSVGLVFTLPASAGFGFSFIWN